MTTVIVHRSAISAYGRSREVLAFLQSLGDAVADDAQIAAPKLTGAGAESIHAETGTDSDGAYVRVSWDSAHFYMFYSEVGTSRQSAQPFLRPALEKRRSL